MQLGTSHSAITSWVLMWISLTARRTTTSGKIRENKRDMMASGSRSIAGNVMVTEEEKRKQKQRQWLFQHLGGRSLCLKTSPSLGLQPYSRAPSRIHPRPRECFERAKYRQTESYKDLDTSAIATPAIPWVKERVAWLSKKKVC